MVVLKIYNALKTCFKPVNIALGMAIICGSALWTFFVYVVFFM